MSCPVRLVWLCPALALLAAGCALNAVRPPTPAAYLNMDRNEPPSPGEHYYILIWASQRVLRIQPAYTHSFATIVHTVEPGPGQVTILDAHTISWLPATLDIRTLACHPEPGVNLTLQETLEYVRQNRERVSLWGPFECRTNVYRRFLVQKDFLETSGIGYQCVDNWGEAARTGDGCDCIHAITDGTPSMAATTTPSSGTATRPANTWRTGCASAAGSTPTSSTTRSWQRSACAITQSGAGILTTG